MHTAFRAAREIWETLIYRGWGLAAAVTRDMRLPGWFGHRDWPADPRDPVHHAAIYPEVITRTGLLASPQWRPFAMSASAADRNRFRTELPCRLPPACRNLASTDLQLLAFVRHAAVAPWHQPTAETHAYPAAASQ